MDVGLRVAEMQLEGKSAREAFMEVRKELDTGSNGYREYIPERLRATFSLPGCRQ
ncbi:TPA: hypothetical protein HA318_00265 [Candidatus Micrarchaeota archaeon]|nr:hypothetical protein [Candidatus Micrarchaeota archaeon]